MTIQTLHPVRPMWFADTRRLESGCASTGIHGLVERLNPSGLVFLKMRRYNVSAYCSRLWIPPSLPASTYTHLNLFQNPTEYQMKLSASFHFRYTSWYNRIRKEKKDTSRFQRMDGAFAILY
ncbi:hypothetical protein ACKLNR_001695 [Fusarium oxysporum f. sp. zingiberi]